MRCWLNICTRTLHTNNKYRKLGGSSTTCTGELIGERWMLTAAHCILNSGNTGYKSAMPATNTVVVYGCKFCWFWTRWQYVWVHTWYKYMHVCILSDFWYLDMYSHAHKRTHTDTYIYTLTPPYQHTHPPTQPRTRTRAPTHTHLHTHADTKHHTHTHPLSHPRTHAHTRMLRTLYFLVVWFYQ